ncbi:3'-5' exonuclease [Micromonospora sp. DT229]|uniref:3'-5' exonuclease n=1 Tax=Micromonospora sp. DT229 TaxID=3393430 RepID=UPI003CF4D010
MSGGRLGGMASGGPTNALLQRLIRILDPDVFVLRGDGSDRPDLIVVDERRGVLIVDVDIDGTSPGVREPFVRLNRKIAELREVAPVLEVAHPHRLVLLGACVEKVITAGARLKAMSPVDLEVGDWLSHLEPRPISARDAEALRSALAPSLSFDLRARRGAADPGRSDRLRRRVSLDAQQAVAATGPVADVLVVTGPPGSGKTLVLAGRARHLAAHHPDWRIVLLCYNRTLATYLGGLVADCSNIEVETFGRFSHGQGHRIDLEDDGRALQDLAKARGRGIPQNVDALLIDEAQDFGEAWLGFALETVRPRGGGTTIGMDERQALYRDGFAYSALAGRDVEYLRLDRAYRSTPQILTATAAAYPDIGLPEVDGEVPDGEPVELIWAATWDEQAAAVAWEVRRMIDSGERQAGDIAILMSQWRGMTRRLRDALDEAEVPYVVVSRTAMSSFDPDSPAVKIMTVHGAKGYEFDVVVMVGLETVPDMQTSPVGSANWARVGLVGMTRARDQLLAVYTKDTPVLERLQKCESVRSWTWPDDYER